MEANLVLVKDANVGSRVKPKNHDDKRAKKMKTRYSDPDPDFKKFERPCSHSGKTYFCYKIRHCDVKLIRRKLYHKSNKTEQDMKLCHMISVLPSQRKRSRNIEPKSRLLNIVYFLKRYGVGVRVCQSFFRYALAISVHRINHVAKFINQGEAPKETRGGDHMSMKSVDKREKVKEFIGQLRGQESH